MVYVTITVKTAWKMLSGSPTTPTTLSIYLLLLSTTNFNVLTFKNLGI